MVAVGVPAVTVAPEELPVRAQERLAVSTPGCGREERRPGVGVEQRPQLRGVPDELREPPQLAVLHRGQRGLALSGEQVGHQAGIGAVVRGVHQDPEQPGGVPEVDVQAAEQHVVERALGDAVAPDPVLELLVREPPELALQRPVELAAPGVVVDVVGVQVVVPARALTPVPRV